jgi:BMFP domain-containing protein YqiC
MALINCPDCKNQISDSADKCIHCGRPMRQSRESILAEIQNAMIERQSIYDLQDEILNRESYFESDAESNIILRERLDKVQTRINELEARLK